MTKFEEKKKEAYEKASMKSYGNTNGSTPMRYLLNELENAGLLKEQQALPVVPECVAEFVSGYENELSKADRIAYLLKSVQGDSYYLTEELPGDGTITVDEGQELYNWAICQHHETILKLWNGYQVEKPQLFYLKNKLTGFWLMRDESDKVFPYDHTFDIRNGDKFTQQEIGSMQTGSYEQIGVEE